MVEKIEKKMKYNPDNLFKNNNMNKEIKNSKEKNDLIEVKDSLFMKIWKKIKRLFKKN